MIKINGEKVNADEKNISAILADMGYSEKRVAVELNEQIVPKAEYDTTFVCDGDNLEIVRFVGGG
ncbi:MAG: sulfur carrier protein ThiS [Ruminococcus sp.]|nr:sulfur carrier protein ThiS [Ruminococcus sp.]